MERTIMSYFFLRSKKSETERLVHILIVKLFSVLWFLQPISSNKSDSNLAPFLGDLSQSKKNSEIKPPLTNYTLPENTSFPSVQATIK